MGQDDLQQVSCCNVIAPLFRRRRLLLAYVVVHVCSIPLRGANTVVTCELMCLQFCWPISSTAMKHIGHSSAEDACTCDLRGVGCGMVGARYMCVLKRCRWIK